MIFSRLLNRIKKLDFVLLLAPVLLVLIGMISIFSSSVFEGDYTSITKQGIFLILSLVAMFIVSLYDYRKLRENNIFILSLYGISMILLLGVLFLAPNIRGIASWYKIGPISFDPIEPAKIALILLLAKYFSSRTGELYHFKHILISGFYAAIPMALVFKQPDFGAVVIFLLIWLGMLLVAGVRKKHFVILILCFSILFVFSFNFLLKDYQKERITSFLSSEEDVLDSNWNKNQAQIAIGSGGFLGKGFSNGTQAKYGFLPESKTDFIFASIAEEFGFLGIIIIFGLYSLFFFKVLKIGLNARSNFVRLFAAGFSITIFVQMFINVSMNLGILPVVGLPLPFVSYGGSNLLFNFISIGILQNIKNIEG